MTKSCAIAFGFIATLVFGLVWAAVAPASRTAPIPSRPIVTQQTIVPLTQPGVEQVTWTVAYPSRAMSEARQHANGLSVFVLKGTFTLVREDRTQTYEQGQFATIPAGTPHQWINHGAGDGVLIVTGVAPIMTEHADVCGGAY